jgi:hypothetical protein
LRVARRDLKDARGPIGPITTYGRTARFGAGTFREPIKILSNFLLAPAAGLVILFPFRISGWVIGGENHLFAERPSKAGPRRI